jgi:hypothetical protein
MKLDTNRQKLPLLYHFFDWMGMPLVARDILSYKDSLGRLILMWIAYGMPAELEQAIESCLRSGKKKWELVRHPSLWIKTSRDHWSYFIIYRKMLSKKYDSIRNIFFDDFVKDIPYMRGINIWVKALQEDKKSLRRYYAWAIFGAILRTWWNGRITKIGFIGPERSNEWWIEAEELLVLEDSYVGLTNGHDLQINLTRWQKFWRKLLVPVYTLHNKGWQLFVLPDDPRKETLKRILRKPVGQSNYMLRLLLGDLDMSEEEVLNMPNMSGYRSGTALNESCRRDVYELPDQDNLYEKVLTIWLFYYLKRKQFRELGTTVDKIAFLENNDWLRREIGRAARTNLG